MPCLTINAILEPAELSALAVKINAEHAAVEASVRSSLEHARQAGQFLIQAKAGCKAGSWLPWIAANVRFSARVAQNYMRIAEKWQQLTSKYETVSHLGVREALDMLVEREMPAQVASKPPVEDEPDDADETIARLFDALPPEEQEKVLQESRQKNVEATAHLEPLEPDTQRDLKSIDHGDKAANRQDHRTGGQVAAAIYRLANEEVRSLESSDPDKSRVRLCLAHLLKARGDIYPVPAGTIAVDLIDQAIEEVKTLVK